MKKKILMFIFILIAALLFLINIQNSTAWDNNVTHKDLSLIAAEKSVIGSPSNYLQKLGYKNGLDEKFRWNGITLKVKDWLQEGAYLEDAGTNTQGILGLARYNNHFHNPLYPWGSAGLNDLGYIGASAIFWAQYGSWQASSPEGDWSWKKIRDCFYSALTSKNDADRQANFAQTFRGLGHQMHLIQDMSVPAHVRNDAHPSDSLLEFNLLTGDYYFETWAKKYYWQINPYAAAPVFPKVDLNITRNGLSPISQFIDTDQYYALVPLTNSLTWGLSEYTNINFMSDDTIFTERFNIRDVHSFPYPRYTDQAQCYEQYEEPYGFEQKRRTYWRKKCPGEPVEHFVRVGPFFKHLDYWFLQREDLWFDHATHNDYASKLIPRAVGYSAGLLNYFFRGKIEAVDAEHIYDASGNVSGMKLKIKNKTQGEAMGPGKFIVSYQYKNGGSDDLIFGISNEVKSDENIYSGDVTANDLNFTYTDPIPSSAQETQYFLIYRGKLGSEENAVVAGKVNASGEYIFLVNTSSLQIQLFKIGTSNGLYQLTPAEEDLKIKIANVHGRNLTVQSNPEETEHYAVFSTEYYAYIISYGIYLGGGYFGSPYYYRPEDFTNGSPYIFAMEEVLPYGNHLPVASGRRPFLVSDGELVAKDITIFKENLFPNNRCDNNHYIAYKDQNDQWVKAIDLPKTSGEDKATNHTLEIKAERSAYWPYYPVGYEIIDHGIYSSSTPTCPDYFAILSPEQAVYNTHESEETYVDSISPGAGAITNKSRHNPAPGVFRDETTSSTYAEKKSTFNKLTTYRLYFGQDLIDEFGYNENSITLSVEKIDFEKTSETTGVWDPWNGIGTTDPYTAIETYSGNISGNTKAIPQNGSSYTGFDMSKTSTEKGKRFVKIWDYDHYENDKYYIGISEYNEIDISGISKSVTANAGIAGSSTSYSYNRSCDAAWTFYGTYGSWNCDSWAWDPAWKIASDGEGGISNSIFYSGNNKERKVTKYTLFYKVNDSLHTVDLGVSNTSRDYEMTWELIDKDKAEIKETNLPLYGQRINSVSFQINKTNMVYTFVVEKYNGKPNNWDFVKRIIGIINISDNTLPQGFRQEFDINDVNASQFISDNYDYKNFAAIGVHKIK
jgi:hypothetical protein